MEARYERNFPALTEGEWAVLRKKKVLVVGCGGLGGHLVDQLARLGVGAIRAVDGDVFEASNLNRQLLSQVSLLGVQKAAAAAERLRQVNPDVRVEAVAEYLTEENADRLVSGCDAVLDALDNIPGRKLLAAACARAGIPYVYGAVQGWVAQAGISMPGDGLLDALYPGEITLTNKSVLSFTPALCASIQSALCVKLLVGRQVNSGTIYYFDLLHHEFEEIPMVV